MLDDETVSKWIRGIEQELVPPGYERRAFDIGDDCVVGSIPESIDHLTRERGTEDALDRESFPRPELSSRMVDRQAAADSGAGR